MILPSTLTLSFLAASTSLFTIVSAADGDWASNWSGPERILEKSFDVDLPLDPRAMMRGSGQITLGNDIAKFKGSPRLYISNDVDGWGDVEITAYGKYVDQGTTPFKSYSGLTLVTRSNHHNYADKPCDAFAYYARIYQESGECAFQKEYYHSPTTGTVYTKTKRVPCFEGGLPLDQWVGMKFQVMTVPGTSDVTLELYLDENDDGNWVLSHSVTDTPGFWESNTSTTVPSECPQNDGDTVIRPGGVSFLRTDGVDETTEVHWRDVSMVNMFTGTSGPTSSPRPTASPITLAPVSNHVDPTCSTGIEGGNDACCPATCGKCGGSGCGDLPGGSSNCCTGSISTSSRSCNDFLPPCIMGTVVTPQPTSMPTSSPTNVPSKSPSKAPTFHPTSASPTMQPSAKPVTDSPTTQPTLKPGTDSPTVNPSSSPSHSPSKQPTLKPVTSSPTEQPTAKLVTDSPTKEPTAKPVTESPTMQPSKAPTFHPISASPTSPPSVSPTNVPSKSPTDSPTQKPTTSSPVAYCAGYGIQGNCGNNDSSLCCSSQCQKGNGPNAGKCK